ncbi:MAG: NUDIX domain-containing protein [Candidatus Shapirobacteria bacterium]
MNEDVFHLGVKAVIQNNKGEIMLLKVNLKELKGYKGEAYWDIPGGRVKLGDSIEDTLRREVEEETGIKEISILEKIDMVLSNNVRIPNSNGGTFGLILSIYKCVAKKAYVNISDEHVGCEWFKPGKAAKLLETKYPKEFTNKIALLN